MRRAGHLRSSQHGVILNMRNRLAVDISEQLLVADKVHFTKAAPRRFNTEELLFYVTGDGRCVASVKKGGLDQWL